MFLNLTSVQTFDFSPQEAESQADVRLTKIEFDQPHPLIDLTAVVVYREDQATQMLLHQTIHLGFQPLYLCSISYILTSQLQRHPPDQTEEHSLSVKTDWQCPSSLSHHPH